MQLTLPAYAALAIAILAEVVATSSLKLSEGFTQLIPTILSLSSYAVAFYFLSVALQGIPIGIAYGIWSAVGVVAISAIGWISFHQSLDIAAIIGLSLIVAGVLVIQLFSKAATLPS